MIEKEINVVSLERKESTHFWGMQITSEEIEFLLLRSLYDWIAATCSFSFFKFVERTFEFYMLVLLYCVSRVCIPCTMVASLIILFLKDFIT